MATEESSTIFADCRPQATGALDQAAPTARNTIARGKREARRPW